MKSKFHELTAQVFKTMMIDFKNLACSDKEDTHKKTKLIKLIEDAIHWSFVNGQMIPVLFLFFLFLIFRSLY